jgi:hypothetical protein
VLLEHFAVVVPPADAGVGLPGLGAIPAATPRSMSSTAPARWPGARCLVFITASSFPPWFAMFAL